MSVTTSYPGLYIQELPASTHAITPAPTSIAAFVGYTHPYRTKIPFGVAQQIFSFTDYETYFGGLFTSGLIDPSLPRAVFEFFLNGGSNAYVVGIQPKLYDGSTPAKLLGVFGQGAVQPVAKITTSGTNGIAFAALEPTDVVPMTVTIANPNATAGTFDIVVTYGARIETYRGVKLTTLGPINAASSLVQLSPVGGSFGTTVPTKQSVSLTIDFTAAALSGFTTTFEVADFLEGGSTPAVFDANSSLDKIEIFNLLLVPGVSDNTVLSAALSFAERKRAFAILDPPPQAPASGASTDALVPIQYWMDGTGPVPALPQSQNGALYFPYLNSTDPVTSLPVTIAPGGFVAGIYASTDVSRGVWKAPAGLATILVGTTGPVASGLMNDPQHGVLNPLGIDCLRSFAGTGTVVFGARTLVSANSAFQQSRYVPVRRMTLFLEQTFISNLKWVVFEPNDEPLWTAIRTTIESFMLGLFRQGALQGSTPSEAFQVKCDASTTTPDDQANGIVNIIVAFAPLKPAEFVIIKIAQLAGQSAT